MSYQPFESLTLLWSPPHPASPPLYRPETSRTLVRGHRGHSYDHFGHTGVCAMPWGEFSVIELREEFVSLALAPGANVSELCRRFGIERSNGYKWLARYKAEGHAGLADRSRRP